MYLYDIDENTCINLTKISSMELVGNPAIFFKIENEAYYKGFSTKEEAREEYERIKAMINNPPMFMTLDGGQLNNFMKKKGRE